MLKHYYKNSEQAKESAEDSSLISLKEFEVQPFKSGQGEPRE